VKTARGDVVDCRAVVHCMNGYSAGLLPELEGSLVPVRNQVAVAAPPAGARLPVDAAVYAREGYVYYSPRADGRMVIGGFRDTLPHREVGTHDDGSLDPLVSAALRGYLPAHFPQHYAEAGPGTTDTPPGDGRLHVEYEMEWAGILGFTKDRFPLVGPLPALPEGSRALLQGSSSGNTSTSRAGQYICAGFSGHGMTRSFSCAEAAARMLLGLPPSPDAPMPQAFLPQGRM